MSKPTVPLTHADRVLQVLQNHSGPLSAYRILHALSDDGITAPTTVYRALNSLQKTGKVHRIESLNAWTACCEPHHASPPVFEICACCGGVAEHVVRHLCGELQMISSESGFAPDHFVIEIHGRCSDCSTTELTT